jgi:hypothetical protein
MPIEIRELHIRVAVSPPQGAGSGSAGPATPTPAVGAGAGIQPQEALVAECIEQALRILQNKMER